MPRGYVPRETRLIREWLAEFHPTALQWRRVRLGAIPGTPEAAIYKGIRHWADCIFFEDDTVHIVEAKMRPLVDAIAQLELYNKLFDKTPEFKQYWDKPRKLETVDAMCKEKGIELVVYTKPWVEEYWKKVIARI